MTNDFPSNYRSPDSRTSSAAARPDLRPSAKSPVPRQDVVPAAVV